MKENGANNFKFEDCRSFFLHVLRQSGHRFEAASMIRGESVLCWRSFAAASDGWAWELQLLHTLQLKSKAVLCLRQIWYGGDCSHKIQHRLESKPVSMGQVDKRRSRPWFTSHLLLKPSFGFNLRCLCAFHSPSIPSYYFMQAN